MSSTGMDVAFDLPARRTLPTDRREAIRRLLEETVAGGEPVRRRPPVRRVLWSAVGLATAAAAAAAVLVVGDAGSGGTDVEPVAATPPLLAAELSAGQPAGPELRSLAAAAAGPPMRMYAAAEPTVTTESWVLVVTEAGGAPGEGAAPPEGLTPAEGAAASLSVDAQTVTAAVVPVVREQRFLADGSVHVRETEAPPRFPSAEWRGSGDQAGTVLSDETFPAGTLDSGYPADLATDSGTLREQLLAVWPQADPAAALFRALHEVTSTRVVDASVQAAALTLLSREPGVVALGATTDRHGRDAVAFATDSADTGADTRYVLLVDPVSGRLLGYEEVLTGDTGALDLTAPVVAAYTAFL